MVDELVRSLLYEGYALYPYTPGATKNATPTPFGIVYPPAYAEQSPRRSTRARLQCLAEPAGPDARLSASLWFLQPSGERHEAVERHVELGPLDLGQKVSAPFGEGRFTLRSEQLADGRWRVSSCVHNTTSVEGGLDRAAALLRSLISTHIVVRISAGRFVSPLESDGCESVNTFPVLATADDDAVLGARSCCPTTRRLRRRAAGNLFDNTEIEEALLLHVQALSDEERASIADQDPAPYARCSPGPRRPRPRTSFACTGAWSSRPRDEGAAAGSPGPRRHAERGRGRGGWAHRPQRRSCRPCGRPATCLRPDARGRPARVKRILVDYDGRSTSASLSRATRCTSCWGHRPLVSSSSPNELEVLGA